MKVKNCFVSGDKVFLFIENILRVINYNQLDDEFNNEDIVIELFNEGPEGHV